MLVDQFKPKDKVDVIGISKGRGFAGVVKRHHFRGGEGSHGSMFHRAPGSIGASSFPSRVVPGMRMGGHMGNAQVTVRNLEVIEVDTEDNVLVVKGAVPGPERRLRGGAEGEEVTAMPTVDVVDLNNQKVGELELADAVFGAESTRRCSTKRCGSTRRAARGHAQDQGSRAKWPVRARSCGSRRARAGRAWARSGRRSGAMAARCMGRSRAITATSCRARCCWARCARRSRPSAGRRVEGGPGVQASPTTRPRAPCDALAKLEAGRTVLVVDNGENRNLALGARNLKGVTLVRQPRSQSVSPAGPRERAAVAKRRRASSRRRSRNDHP